MLLLLLQLLLMLLLLLLLLLLRLQRLFSHNHNVLETLLLSLPLALVQQRLVFSVLRPLCAEERRGKHRARRSESELLDGGANAICVVSE